MVTFMMKMLFAASKSFSKTDISPAYRLTKFPRTAVKFFSATQELVQQTSWQRTLCKSDCR